MNPCRGSLTCRMIALILVGAGLVLLLVEGFSYISQRRRVVSGAVDHGETLTRAVVQQIESSFGRAEAIVLQNALFLEDGRLNRRETTDLIRRTLEARPALFGMAVALSKSEAEQSDFDILYGWRNGDTVAVDDRPTPEEDYRQDWFRLPAEKQAPVWTEPYLDKQASTAMVTYSVPMVCDGKTIGVVTCDLSLDGIRSLIDALPLEEGSFALLLSGKGTFISHPQDELEMVETVFSLADAQDDPESAETFRHLGRSLLGGQPGWLRYRQPHGKEWAYVFHENVPCTGWALGVIRSEAEVLAPLIQLNRVSMTLGVAGLALLLVPAVGIAWSVVRPVRRLADAANRLAAGDFDAPLPVSHSDDEVGQLTGVFDRMRSDLRQYIADLTATTAAKEKIASELSIARAIQLSIVPKLFPPFPDRADIDLYAVLVPAREVGGDLYDFGLLDDEHLYVAIGDVSGKGIPASLLMAVGKTLLKSTLYSLRDPALALAHVNAELSEDNDACMFITMFCGMIHLKTGDMIYSSAGHNPPLLLRGTGLLEWLTPASCPPVGICPGIAYHNHSARLAPGDLLLLYTDGITEAMDPSDVLFGNKRLLDFARQHREDSARDLVEALCQVVHAHAAGAEQSDDITALAVRYLATPDEIKREHS